VTDHADLVRAVVWDGERLAVDDSIAVRPPGEGEVSVDIDLAGLCHSDLSAIEGRIPAPTPTILGHEAVGVVSATGADATVEVGQRVVLTLVRRCGRCRYCRQGRPMLCSGVSTTVPSPFSRRGEVVHQFVKLGAFSERITVASEQVVPVPEDISSPVAAMLCCASVTAFGAVEHRAGLGAGETALVTGAGGIGLNVVLAARAAGAERVVVVDRNPAKEQIARRCGATDFLLVDDASAIPDAVRDLVPEGVDAAFECVGHVGLLEASISALAPGGRVVVLGIPPAEPKLEVSVRTLFHDKALLGCRMGSVDPHTMLPRLVERVQRGELDLTPLVSAVLPMAEIGDLVDRLRSGSIDRGFIEIGRS
jgi:Zn-dependent alcohol dehydrogenase